MPSVWPVLHRGSTGPEVGNLQRFLASRGWPLEADEQFGTKTEGALTEYQAAHTPVLSVTNIFDAATRSAAVNDGFIPFLQAKHFSPHWPRIDRPVRILVIHTMENSEKPSQAENVARWFAGASAPNASAHYCVDASSTVQCVRDGDEAWHAPGANGDGIGIEHAGTAAQTPDAWHDEYSVLVLLRSAKLAAALCLRHDIPATLLTPLEIRDPSARGLCGHVDISKAFGGTHWDPGPNFPWSMYLAAIRSELEKLRGEDVVAW